MINATLRAAEKVVFLTLNYDTLLDSRLFHHTPIGSFGDYIHQDLPWALVKLHGSVDWMRPVLNDPPEGVGHDAYLANYVRAWGEELEVGSEIIRRATTIEGARADGMRRFYYPALSVPLGPDDELNCPDEHVEFARERLASPDGLHIISVGYSGLDSGLLELLTASENELRSLLAINNGAGTAIDAAGRIAGALNVEASAEMAFPGNFETFVWEGGLEGHLNGLG